MRGAQLPGMVRTVLVVVGGLALFCLPASAQKGSFTSGPSNAFSVSSSFLLPSVSSPWPHPARPAILQLSLRDVKFEGTAAGYGILSAERMPVADANTIAWMTSSFERIRTPFLNQVRVPLVSVWNGHVQLSGFESVAPMENLLWGLPLKASVTGGSIVQQCHPGIRLPRNNQSYGLSLRFRFSKQDAGRAGNGLWNAGRQAVSWGHTFLTL